MSSFEIVFWSPNLLNFSRLLRAFSSVSSIVVVNLFRHIAASLSLVANIFSCSATMQPIRLPVPSIFVSHSHFLFLSDDEDDVSDSAKSGWWLEGGRLEADTELATFLAAVQTTGRWITFGIFVLEPRSSSAC